MSFILDALKKSEENRSGNLTPQAGKHILIPHFPARKRGVLIAICILIPLLSLMGGWWIGRQPEQPAILASDPINQIHKADKQPSIPVAKQTRQQLPAQDQTIQKNTKAPTPVQKQSQNIVAPVPQRHQEVTAPLEALPQSPPNSIPSTAPGTATTEEVPFYDELPSALQRDIGSLRVSLHFFSSDPARRMLRINGTIRHEKENITADLSIAEIRETSTLFNYRGTLFELPAPGQ